MELSLLTLSLNTLPHAAHRRIPSQQDEGGRCRPPSPQWLPSCRVGAGEVTAMSHSLAVQASPVISPVSTLECNSIATEIHPLWLYLHNLYLTRAAGE